MGDLLSTLSSYSTTNPSEIQHAAPMSQAPEFKFSNEDQTPIHDSSDPHGEKETLEDHQEQDGVNRKGEKAEEDEEEGECPFCLFMKGGECRESFIEWEECVKEGEKNKEDIGEKCCNATSALMKCIKANPDYYAPILRAEEDFDQQKEKEKDASESSSSSIGSMDSGDLKEEVN